jgi:hypothetical protein
MRHAYSVIDMPGSRVDALGDLLCKRLNRLGLPLFVHHCRIEHLRVVLQVELATTDQLTRFGESDLNHQLVALLVAGTMAWQKRERTAGAQAFREIEVAPGSKSTSPEICAATPLPNHRAPVILLRIDRCRDEGIDQQPVRRVPLRSLRRSVTSSVSSSCLATRTPATPQPLIVLFKW